MNASKEGGIVIRKRQIHETSQEEHRHKNTQTKKTQNKKFFFYIEIN